MQRSMDTYTHAYIYLIREREFIRLNEPVFKIGRGAQNADRVVKRVATGYKKGSEIWLTIRCPITLYKNVETSLKSMFCERFQKHGDGSEYFSGDPTRMIQIITDVVHNSWLQVETEPLQCRFTEGDMTQHQLEVYEMIQTRQQQIAQRRALHEEQCTQFTKQIAEDRADVLKLYRLLGADKKMEILESLKLVEKYNQITIDDRRHFEQSQAEKSSNLREIQQNFINLNFQEKSQ